MLFRNCYKNECVWMLCSVIVLSLGGCASTQLPEPSGFLSDYSNISKERTVEGVYLDRSSKLRLKDYKKIIIEPVVISFLPEAKGKVVDPEKLNQLTQFFQEEIIKVFKVSHTIVEKPETGAMKLRVAITDVVPNNVLLNLHASSAIIWGPGVGKASMEAEFVDAMTNERIVALVDRRRGKTYKYYKALTKWGHTKDILKEWAKFLNNGLKGE